MRILFFLLLINSVIAIDVIIESLKQLIDKSTNPCDNFYRHVCPLGSPSYLVFKMINSDLKSKNGYKVWNSFELITDFGLLGNRNRNSRTTRSATSIDYAAEISTLYKNICEKRLDTEQFLARLTEILRPIGQKMECSSKNCMLRFKDDSNCERVEKHLKILISEVDQKFFTRNFIAFGSITSNLWNIRNISYHLDNNLEDGIEETHKLVEDMKSILLDIISETPWAQNNNITELASSVLESTHLKSDYAKILRDSFDVLLRNELDYRQCKRENGNSESAQLFCALSICKTILDTEGYSELNNVQFFVNIPNAGNAFPYLMFGLPMYYITKNTEEKAAKLGSIGFTVGHEISHTIIEDGRQLILTYFSDEAKDCFQNQYNKTCSEFKEKGCETYDKQIDENGSDILSIQIAYKMLEEHYGESLFDIYEPLNVTYQQLFFYSAAVSLCDGQEQDIVRSQDGSLDEHASHYIRINAIANHPAFKEAFQCADDSRMIISATEQCFIYGKDAPQNKRH